MPDRTMVGKKDEKTTKEVLEGIRAYLSDPKHEKLSQASDVVANNLGHKMLIKRRAPRRQQFILLLIGRQVWAPSAVAAFYRVLCRANQAPTATDVLLLLGQMAPGFKAEIRKAEENELTTWAPRLTAFYVVVKETSHRVLFVSLLFCFLFVWGFATIKFALLCW